MNRTKRFFYWLMGIPMVCVGVAVLVVSYFTGLSRINAVLLTGFGLVVAGAVAWVWKEKRGWAVAITVFFLLAKIETDNQIKKDKKKSPRRGGFFSIVITTAAVIPVVPQMPPKRLAGKLITVFFTIYLFGIAIDVNDNQYCKKRYHIQTLSFVNFCRKDTKLSPYRQREIPKKR